MPSQEWPIKSLSLWILCDRLLLCSLFSKIAWDVWCETIPVYFILESDRPRMYQVMTVPSHIRNGTTSMYSNTAARAEQVFWRCLRSCTWFKTVIILVSRSSLGSIAVPEPVCVRKRSSQMPRLVTVSIKRSEKICDRKYENSFSAVHNNFTLYALTSNVNKLHSRRQRTELRMILSPALGQIAFGHRSMKTDTY